MEKINIAEKLRFFDKYWQSKQVGDFNSQQMKLVKMKGDFEWHYHKTEDEFYLVLKGALTAKFQDSFITVKEGEFFVVPKGLEHKLVAEEEVHLLLFEPSSTLNTSGETRKDAADTVS